MLLLLTDYWHSFLGWLPDPHSGLFGRAISLGLRLQNDNQPVPARLLLTESTSGGEQSQEVARSLGREAHSIHQG